MDFFGSMQYNIYIQNIFLISPFYYSREQKKLILPQIGFISFSLFLIGYLLSTWYLFQNLTVSMPMISNNTADDASNKTEIVSNKPGRRNHNDLVTLVIQFEVWVTILSVVVFSTANFYYRHVNLKYFNLIHDFDHQIMKFTNDRNLIDYKAWKSQSIFYILVVFCYYFVLQILVLHRLFHSESALFQIAGIFCYVYASGLGGFNAHTYMAFLSTINERFIMINKCLKEFTEDGVDSSKSNFKQLYKIFNLFRTLASGIDMINNAFGIQCLIMIAHDFTLITSQLYGLYNTIVDQETTDKVINCLAIGLCMLPNAVKLGSVTFLGHITINSVKRIEELFRWANHHSLKNNDYKYTDEMNKLIEYFSYRKLHYQYKFTANKFVSINATLMFTIVSAITTYLVILIQFKNYEDENA